MRVLVVNAGSSSLKVRLLGPDDAVERTADTTIDDLPALLDDWPQPDAVGHRVVHGGTRFTDPTVVDPGVRSALEELTALAPLHQPRSLAGVDAVTRLLPSVPAVACFDTAFHASLGEAAATYPIPRKWRDEFGIRRYGFHGLSHAWCAGRVASLLGRSEFRLVSCHLGAGASLAGVVDGRSVDTTMGFTPLEGLVMATRSGTVDPGLVLWLVQHGGLRPEEVSTALEEESGLTALAGTGDLREIPEDSLALDVYVHRLVGAVASMAAAAGGLDAVAFTGGVGEHSAVVRARAAAGLAFLGVAVSPSANDAADGDTDITAPGAAVRTFVVAAREDLEIARGTRAALSG